MLAEMSGETFSCQGLIEAILLFCRRLQKSGFKTTPARVHDVLKGLSFIHIGDKSEFRILLQANLVSSRDELALFKALFQEFWHGTFGELFTFQGGEEGVEDEWRRSVLELENETKDEGETERVGASLEVVEKTKDFSEIDARELKEVEFLVLRIARQLGYRLGRRFKAARMARLIDFRRSFHQSLRHGGELLELGYRKRRLRHPYRIYLLLDISGSMDIYGHFFLLFMYGLQRILFEAETFVFSTFLTCATPYLRRFSFEEALRRIQTQSVNWSGGTDIGTSLMQFYTRHLSDSQHSKSVVIIVSDGWDRGNLEELGRAMKLIRLQAHEIFWLNPLAGSPEYEPLCQGMRCVLPHVDHFLPFHNLESLASICHRLEQPSLM
ncbi:MAG: VWA domain-containing protein [Pseudomonadota bacterium]